MNTERTVFLLVGPRGAGKTYYGQRLAKANPDLQVVSRDEILMRECGSVQNNRYSGALQLARGIMDRMVQEWHAAQTPTNLLLDCWTGYSMERKDLLDRLRRYGVKRIVALYFTTPEDTVEEWFWLKPGIAKVSEMKSREGEKGLTFFSENTPRRDHALFHEMAEEIDSDGFDGIIRVDPHEELILLT